MTAPVAAQRQNPVAAKLGDGFQTLVTLSGDTNIDLWEKSITPPGIEADEPVDTTTQINTTWRTKSPRGLLTLTDMTFTCLYNPGVLSQILAIINDPITITVEFPNHDTWAFYGALRSFVPGPLEDGTPPEATVTIFATNQDPTTCAEEGPVYAAGSGTGGC